MGFCSCNSLHNVYMSIIPQEHLFTMQYYPTDFFYSTNANDMPNGFEGCTILSEETENIVCNKSKNSGATISSDNMSKCYQKELCKNQTVVNKLYQLRNSHYKSQEQYENLKQKYNFEIVKTVNLLIGIVFAVIFIRNNKP